MFDFESQNYYEILDIKPDASPTEIRNAYFRAKTAYSKDSEALYSIFDEHETQLVLEKVEQAYLVLSNPEKRKEYDKFHGILSTGSPQPSSPTKESGTFSFTNKSSSLQDDEAQIAASNVLSGSLFEEIPNRTAAEPEQLRSSQQDTSQYSTPRTLSEASQHTEIREPETKRPEPELSKSYENKLGIVRRIDIVNVSKDPEIESLIQTEVEFRGAFLKKIRELRGISIDELSEFTKIGKNYLNCVESEEFENLPAAVYVRGFISQIAKALKIPADKTAQGYMDHYKKTYLK